MATEADIELLEKKRKDIVFLQDAATALADIFANAGGVEILIKTATGVTFSTASLKEKLIANGVDEQNLFAAIETAVNVMVGDPVTADTIAFAIETINNTYDAAIAAE